MPELILVVLALFASGTLAAQEPMHLTLPEAERLAIKNNPALTAAQLTARAVGQASIEIGSGLQPTVFGSFTAVGADSGSRIAAGSLNNPSVYNRVASGVTVNQLITDFGRTRSLIESAKFNAAAQNQVAETVDANIVLQTDRAYFAVLRSQSVLTVSQQTVTARELVSNQVTQLAQNALKSQLDVSFANVNLAQARIQLSAARNDLSSAIAQLATVLGLPSQDGFVLDDEPMPGPLDTLADPYIQAAIQKRPELANLRFEVNAAESTLRAERASWYPTIGVIGTAGVVPAGDAQVPGRYGAVGANMNIPIFNGGLFKARRTEAEFRLESARKSVEDLQNRVMRDVKLAWLDARTSYEQVGLTGQLLDQARLAQQLAQGRYDLGLSSIVELSQAQLNFTAAQIANAGARFDYQSQRSFLRYETGDLR